MANRDYKNIKRFVDNLSQEVAETMEGGGTVGGVDISPVVVLKNGGKIKIDFSVGTYTIGNYASGQANYPMDIDYVDFIANKSVSDYGFNFESDSPLSVEIHAGINQLVAVICNGEYTQISNEIVIYEGDVSGMNDTSSIASQLPTVEFTISYTKGKYHDMAFCTVRNGFSITN